MTGKIRIGIVGYGNLGRGAELAITQNSDMQLVAVLTRRDPSTVSVATEGARVLRVEDAASLKGEVDVMLLCGGSATDLPEQGPQFAAMFNTIDSFDTHAKIPAYFDAVDKAASANGNLSIISVGWDPGLFSVNRLYAEAVLPEGASYTFWGRGVSQGHSDAIRRVDGVANAVQYTVPTDAALAAVRGGTRPELSARQKHTRACFVAAKPGADLALIEKTIKEMPNYFSDYDTTVTFVSEAELKERHGAMPHGGMVLRSGVSGAGTDQLIEFSLKLGSNPEFTSSILLCYARAAYRLARAGQMGARSVFDIAPGLLSPRSAEELRATML